MYVTSIYKVISYIVYLDLILASIFFFRGRRWHKDVTRRLWVRFLIEGMCYHFFALTPWPKPGVEFRTQHAQQCFEKFGGKWGMEYLNTSFPAVCLIQYEAEKNYIFSAKILYILGIIYSFRYIS